MLGSAKYPEMKDSRIPWIGSIPSSWNIVRAKSVLKNVTEKGHPDAEVLSLYRDYGIVPKQSRDDNHNVTSLDTSTYKYVEPGDLVLNKMKTWQGSLAVSEYAGIVSPAYYVCKFACEDANKRYIHYLLRTKQYAQEFERLSTGMRIGQWDLGIDDFLSIPILLPSPSEQQAISEYLNTKCRSIDMVIEEVKASIEEYKAWKASIIYEAVTKGLDPNVERRETNSKWLPEAPLRTKMSRVGLHYDIILGKMLCPEQVDASYTLEPYFCAANVHFSGVDTENLKEMWFNPKEKEIYKVNLGDLLVVEGGAGAGGSAIVVDYTRETYVQNSIMIVRGRRGNNNGFLKYVLECLVGRGYVEYACNKATIPHFTKEKLGNTPYPVFSPDTQKRIVAYLDEQCSAIDALIGEKEDLISDLESFKKALIFEVVTGKQRIC